MSAQHPKKVEVLDRTTIITQRHHNLFTVIYDFRTYIGENYGFRKFRKELWSRLTSGRVLEVGVGIGQSFPNYPKGCQITGVDISEEKLEFAKRQAEQLGVKIDLQLMDAQNLTFPDNSFDAAVTSCVFCTIPNPVQGMRELGRVVKPSGDIWLLEHMRVDKPIIGPLMDVVNPLALSIMGTNVNRRTVENVKLAGLEIEQIEDLLGQMVRLIHAHPAPFIDNHSQAQNP